MITPCACGCPADVHHHYNCAVYCGRCKCDHYCPVRVRWYQFWRPRLSLGELTDSDLRLLSARPEEIT